MSNDGHIGGIIGLGLTGAFTIGSIAALVYAKKRDERRVDRCQAYYAGELPGYDTDPGHEYLVLVQVDDVMEPVCEATSIWFGTSGEDARFVYDLARSSGALPPLGALLAAAHHRLVGPNYLGKHRSLQGFNLWDQMAGRKWREDGRPFTLTQAAEFELRSGSSRVSGPYHKFFDTPEEAVNDFLGAMRNNWPRAADELKKKRPNPYAYTWYLQATQSVYGGNYASTLKDPGGPWLMGTGLVSKVKEAAQVLHDEASYNGLVEWADELPELSYQDALQLDAEFPDRTTDYPLGGDLP
jgi:hypothetical protein